MPLIIGNEMPQTSIKARRYQQKRRAQMRREGRCYCGLKSLPQKRICQQCSDYGKARLRRLKAIVLQAYGGCCVCCGERTYEFLSIDHKHNDGYAERKRLGRKAQPGLALLRLIIKEKFPERYQILCFNCNMAKGFFGRCPHENYRK